MPLAPGVRLGVYEVLSPLGAGGMGEVYKARDTRLGRDVALKVLPELFANEPDRLARFKREAQVLASLNHPHIAAIYGLEETEGVRALVLELVDGPTLADLIAGAGPRALPIEDVLSIARQIAEALEAAHQHGIVHRDLKPANIKVRSDGMVKVLDFGLAKALDPLTRPSASLSPGGGEGGGEGASQSPTLTSPAATRLGLIIGTAAYMAPEQARGKAVDKRADIWAFGCVLYEMLTGRRAFDGEAVTDVLARILEREPDFAALPAGVPLGVRRVLRRCLQKDPNERWHDMADVRLEMRDALTEPALPRETATTRAAARRWRAAIPWSVAAISAAALLVAD